MHLSDFSLRGKTAIVTGVRRGIGKEIALTFAGAGAEVAVCDYTLDGGELAAVANEIEKIGQHSLVLQVDVTKKGDVDKLADKVLNQFCAVDILVNNAGIIGDRVPILESSEENYDKIMATNLKSYFLCSQAFDKIMVTKKKGVMVNIASTAGLVIGEYGRKVENKLGIYAISKAGVVMLTKYLAGELGPYNIRINAIAPTRVLTPMSLAWANPEEAKRSAAYIPLGHIGYPRDVAAAALFLASDASSFITGH